MEDGFQLTAADQKPARREFFKRFAIGTVGLAASPLYGNKADVAFDSECKASAADSLLFYFQLVFRVQSELNKAITKPVEVGYQELDDTFKLLLEQIEILEQELGKPTMKAQARQMRDLVELGRSNAQLMSVSVAASNKRTSSRDPIDVVNEQVCKVARDLLPKPQVTLSPIATEALRKILCIIEKHKTRPKTGPQPKNNLSGEFAYIQLQIQKVTDSIWAGAEATAKADFGGSGASDSRTKAKEHVGVAISMLKELKAKYDAELRNLIIKDPGHRSLDIDLLIDILTGAQKWVGDPSLLPLAAGRAGKETGGEFRTIANWNRSSPFDNLLDRIGGALANSCQTNTFWRRLGCLALVGPILIQHADIGARKDRIERILGLFGCPHGGSITGLAVLLAEL